MASPYPPTINHIPLTRRFSFLKDLRFWEFIVLLITAVFIAKQLIDTQKSLERNSAVVSQELAISFDDRLSNGINTAVFHGIVNNEDLAPLIANGELDNYLGVYENLNDAYSAHLISDHSLCNMFSDGLLATGDSKNITEYISRIQKEDPTYYVGYQNILGVTRQLCRPSPQLK